MKIIVDAMGGDHAPEAIVKGAVMAAREFKEEIVLVGKEDVIRSLLEKEGADLNGITIRNATEEVDMHDDPSTVLRTKKDSSMAVALNMLAKGEGDALVSAGSTGALLSGATLFVKRIKGIRRGALAPMLPTKTGKALLIDCGANVECTPEYLLQFGFMGSFYMKRMMGVENPRVGLVNNGTEDTKGGKLQKEAYALLKKAGEEGRINFIGNVEGRDVPMGVCDVVVCDGFTGNILLKTVEGVANFLVGMVKGLFMENVRTKLAYLMVKPGMHKFKKTLNYKETGGAPFIGISKPVIKAHGSADAFTFRSAIQQAIIYTNSGIISEISDNIQYMTIDEGN